MDFSGTILCSSALEIWDIARTSNVRKEGGYLEMSEFLNPPLFSVVMPAYESEKYIAAAIKSVISQSVDSLEIIIVLDPSTDNTQLLAEKMAEEDSRINVLCNSSRIGVSESRNQGINFAQGKYIAFLDADDLWNYQKLEKQLEVFCSTDCDVCCTSYSFIDTDGNVILSPYIISEKIDFRLMLKENVIGTSTCALKSEVAKSYRMDDRYYHEDYVYWLSILKNGYKAVGIPEALVQYRLTGDGRSKNKLRSAFYRLKIYRSFLKLGIVKSIYYLICYSLRGALKYH